MSRQELLMQFMGLMVLVFLLAGCQASAETITAAATDTPVVLVVTATPQPTATAMPSTPTPVPPTATPTPILTPTPTLTPTPASTPVVGDTVISPHWKIKIVKVETSQEFSTFTQEDSKFHLIILTTEITYLGPENRGSYSPEAVVMTHMGSSDMGWTNRVILYRGEGSSQVTNLQEASLINYLGKDETRTETFVLTFPTQFTEFLLYFPETPAIAIDLE